MTRILAPYGVHTKDLKNHLINIGFIQKKDNTKIDNFFNFLNYSIDQKKESIILEEKLDIVYKYYNYGNEFDSNMCTKDGLQNQIDCSKNCLIDPFDNGQFNYDNISDIEEEKLKEHDENDDYDDYWDYCDEYSYRRYYF